MTVPVRQCTDKIGFGHGLRGKVKFNIKLIKTDISVNKKATIFKIEIVAFFVFSDY